MSEIIIRTAVPGDEDIIFSFIRELAEYEHMEKDVNATAAVLRENLFERRGAEALVCYLDGRAVGYALFFGSFSTFLARCGIYIEDLYVTPSARGKGCGKALISKVAAIAKERGCARLEWSCLDWNQPSIDFYLSLGAKPLDGWTQYRLTDRDIAKVAEMTGKK